MDVARAGIWRSSHEAAGLRRIRWDLLGIGLNEYREAHETQNSKRDPARRATGGGLESGRSWGGRAENHAIRPAIRSLGLTYRLPADPQQRRRLRA